MGDFNISIENVSNPDTVTFSGTMADLGLQQHVQGPTHKMGNTLDLIFSQLEMQFKVTGTATHGFVSDHYMVSIELSLRKSAPPTVRKVMSDYSKITSQNFTENYTTSYYSHNTTLDEAYHLFEELLKALHQVAPPRTIICTDRQKHPCHNRFIKEQNRVVKNGEKTWRRYRQDHQWQAYTKERNIYNRLLTYHKKQMLSKIIKDSNKHTKNYLS